MMSVKPAAASWTWYSVLDRAPAMQPARARASISSVMSSP